MVNVLVTGSGSPGAAGIIHCIRQSKRYRIVAGDCKPLSIGKLLADDYVQLPVAEDPDFVETVHSICLQKQIRIILPLVTRELPHLASVRSRFSADGIAMVISDPVTLNIAVDKGKLYDHFKECEFIPRYQKTKTVPGLINSITSLGFPENPVCFKPCLANGSRGFRILDDTKDRVELLFQQKPDARYITVAELTTILGTSEIPELLVSEYLPGIEYSVDSFCIDGKMIIALPRKRLRIISGISVEGIFEENLQLIDYTRSIIKELGLNGNIGLQFKAAKDGNFKLLEINPRVQGTISSTLGANVNLVLLSLDFLAFSELPESIPVKWNTGFIRHWVEAFYDA